MKGKRKRRSTFMFDGFVAERASQIIEILTNSETIRGERERKSKKNDMSHRMQYAFNHIIFYWFLNSAGALFFFSVSFFGSDVQNLIKCLMGFCVNLWKWSLLFLFIRIVWNAKKACTINSHRRNMMKNSINCCSAKNILDTLWHFFFPLSIRSQIKMSDKTIKKRNAYMLKSLQKPNGRNVWLCDLHER